MVEDDYTYGFSVEIVGLECDEYDIRGNFACFKRCGLTGQEQSWRCLKDGIRLKTRLASQKGMAKKAKTKVKERKKSVTSESSKRRDCGVEGETQCGRILMLTGALPANANASKTPSQFLALKNGNMTIKVSDMIKQLRLTSKITCTYRPMVEGDYTYGFSVEIVGLSAMNMTYAAISPVFQAMRADWTGAEAGGA